jgi:flavin-dependent dehydrogenase
MKQGPVRIVGGGISGLTTAIVLAQRGGDVEVFERGRALGVTHPVRLDAVENWTTSQDFDTLLARWAIDPAPFRSAACVEVCAHDGERHALRSARPLLYVVKRGDDPRSLDQTLKRQALDLGVRIRYGCTLPRDKADVWAVGAQRRGFFLDAALTFRTTQPDRVAILIDEGLTPKACAYLIVSDGMGTLAVLLTRQFERTRRVLTDAIDAFQRMQPFDMRDPRLCSGFGGALSAFGPPSAGPLVVGEAAGFLDYLWGFGIRHAILSGVLAARALLEGDEYASLVAREIHPLVRTSLINRWLYDFANNAAYRALIRYFCAHQDLHRLMHRFYQSRGARSIFLPWATRALSRNPQ